MSSDTIAAIASPPGVGGVSVIRISGSDAFPICSKLIKSGLNRDSLSDRVVKLVRIRNVDGIVIDDALLTPFIGPRSFTGEDVVELACHGGLLVTLRVLDAVLDAGARAAEAGEFSRRAFENGKLDLTQAEAIMDLISAQTDLALRAANDQLQGRLGTLSEQLRSEIIGIVANVEAYIDFPEEDIDPVTGKSLLGKIDLVIEGIDKMLATAEQGKILREGVRTVICGEPNVGKSSLLNKFLGYDRAIVSDTAGTTRDTLEEVVNVRGIPLRLIDTAGVRDAGDAIEKQGVERSEKQIELADLILEVVDGSQPGERILNRETIGLRHHILILNKADLRLDEKWSNCKGVSVSCKSEQGLEALMDAILMQLSISDGAAEGHLLAINARHQSCLKSAKKALESSRQGLSSSVGAELVSLDLRDALDYIGEISGKIDSEEIFDEIFGTFCIGK